MCIIIAKNAGILIQDGNLREIFIGVTGTINCIDSNQFSTRINETVGTLSANSEAYTPFSYARCIQRTSPLRVGDYVEVASCTNGILDRGEIGIVRQIDDNLAAVEFSHDFPCMHDCDGRIQSRRGRYFDVIDLHLI